MGKAKILRSTFLVSLTLGFMLVVPLQVFAQQPGRPGFPGFGQNAAQRPPNVAGLPPEGEFYRFGFFTIDQYSFQEHPFQQLTTDGAGNPIGGTAYFNDASGALGGTYSFKASASDDQSSMGEKLFHALPPFSYEYGWLSPYPFPAAMSLGIDYVRVSVRDEDALDFSTIDLTTWPYNRFELDAYYIGFPWRMYFKDPLTPGFNFFLGVSLGVLQGNLLVQGVTTTDANGNTADVDHYVSFRSGTVGAVRVGVEATTTKWGFRYEIMMMNAPDIEFSNNPLLTPDDVDKAAALIDMAGTLVRLSAFYKFGESRTGP